MTNDLVLNIVTVTGVMATVIKMVSISPSRCLTVDARVHIWVCMNARPKTRGLDPDSAAAHQNLAQATSLYALGFAP